MRIHRVFATAIVFLIATSFASSALAFEGKVYGKPLTGTEITEIAYLLEHGDKLVGKTVRVQGLVNGVCEKRGCWMSIASTKEEFKEIRIKVEDGVIVFPVKAKGSQAIAEGVLSKIEMTLEQTVQYEKHHAEEHGEDFDPASVTEPLTYFQIQGSGAVIR